MVKTGDFEQSVPLPAGLKIEAIRNSIEYIEREAADLIEIYIEQANVFSAIVGILGTKALDAHSVYEKNRNADIAQQRFPDLCRRGAGPQRSPRDCLESRAASALGPYSPTTITRAGISCGATWLILQR
jgi:hypothetical protein